MKSLSTLPKISVMGGDPIFQIIIIKWEIIFYHQPNHDPFHQLNHDQPSHETNFF